MDQVKQIQKEGRIGVSGKNTYLPNICQGRKKGEQGVRGKTEASVMKTSNHKISDFHQNQMFFLLLQLLCSYHRIPRQYSCQQKIRTCTQKIVSAYRLLCILSTRLKHEANWEVWYFSQARASCHGTLSSQGFSFILLKSLFESI